LLPGRGGGDGSDKIVDGAVHIADSSKNQTSRMPNDYSLASRLPGKSDCDQ